MRKNKNTRTCRGCRESKDKNELVRMYINNENNIQIDENQKCGSRGVYICKNIKCLEESIKKNQITKGLKCKNVDIDYEKIKKHFEKY